MHIDETERFRARWRVLAEALGVVLIAAATFRYWLLYFNRGSNLLDEGSQAAQALRILNGDLIYRDFVTVVTPGSYYTVAWLFWLFGPDLVVLRWAALTLGIGIVIATFVIARHLMDWPFAAAAAALTAVWGWFLVAPNFYTWEAMFFALAALLMYLRHTQSPERAWLIGAGLATGMAFLVKQNIGAYAGVALCLEPWAARLFVRGSEREGVKRTLVANLYFVTSAAAPVVVVVFWLMAKGAGPFLYENWIHYPLLYRTAMALPYPPLYPLLSGLGLFTLRDAIPAVLTGRIPEPQLHELWLKLAMHLPTLVYPFAAIALAGLLILWHRGRDRAIGREGRRLLAIALFGAFTFLQAWPRSDFTHIMFGMQPGFILLAYLSFCVWRGGRLVVRQLRRRLPSGSGVPTALSWTLTLVEGLLLAIALAPEAGFVWNGYKRTDLEYLNYETPLQSGRARGILAHPEEAKRIDQVTAYIRARTGEREPIFVVPWAAGFYFLADRPNPTRFDLMLYGDTAAYPCIIAALDVSRPTYVIYGYVWDVDERRFSEYARPIDQYIRSRYRLETKLIDYEIWRRIESAPSPESIRRNACRPRGFSIRSALRSLRSIP
jgi:hypothetical protein